MLVTQHPLSKVKCVMNSIAADPLRDTGAPMSIISRDWIAGNLPTAGNHRIDDLINKKGLGTEIPYDGWVLWKHASSDDKRGALISTDKLELPIVAYVIGEMVKSTESQSPSGDERTMVNVLWPQALLKSNKRILTLWSILLGNLHQVNCSVHNYQRGMCLSQTVLRSNWIKTPCAIWNKHWISLADVISPRKTEGS